MENNRKDHTEQKSASERTVDRKGKLTFRFEDDRWSLWYGGIPLLEQSRKIPFATAIKREKVYTANRGTVKVQMNETERVPLTEAADDGKSVTLSNGAHTLRIEPSVCKGGVELTLKGEEGWAYEFRLSAIKGEAVFGGGEQYRKTDLRGERVVNFVSEHIKASTVIEKALLPRSLYREKNHSEIGSYAPMPVFVTDRGRLFLFDTASDGVSRFEKDYYSMTFDACPEKVTLLCGETYEELERLLASRVQNRQYLPDWCHDGMILGVQGGTETVLKKVQSMLNAGAKVCAVWCQDWSGDLRTPMGKQVWWNWEVSDQLYPDLRGAIQKLRNEGVRFLAYINPYLVRDSRLYKECHEKGYLITRKDGSVYHIKSTTFDAGMIDLTNPDAVRYVKDELIKKNMLDFGISGWMADFGEYLPVDCVLHDGDPAKLHNLWPVLWAKVNREAVEEYGAEDAMFFSRSGYVGIQTYAPILWNGDQHTDLTKDYGMPCVMPASFSLGFSGVPMVHCDIGGFFSFGKMKRNDELFIRWMEMGSLSLLMRSHESIRPWANSQFDAPGVTPHTVRLTKLHSMLKPYIAHCAKLAGKGVQVMRPDFWNEMTFTAHRDEYAYYLGDDLFVCPVIERRAKRRKVILPKGEWRHLWTGEAYEGGREYTVSAPLGYTTAFYRAGSPYEDLFRRAAEDCK
ncbi:MAG: alpha-glucosidase [Clostridia bacterium]|nr:alpha-glucosidase [Clostridia bacterium]